MDFTADPPAVVAGDAAEPDCYLRLASDDLAQMIDDPCAGQVLAWQGRVHFGGDQALLRRIADVLFPLPEGENSAYAGYYASLSRLIPDPRLTFMNHGYAADAQSLEWLDDADRPWRYSINLIRRVLSGTEIKDARVLDIGCGRGGPASFIARYLDPWDVVGLDACGDAIRFCEDRHPHPNLSFVQGSAEHLPVDDASVDVVLNVESSHCYLDRGSFLSEVARVLKPGGAFCYADIFQPDELRQVRRLLATIPGFVVHDEADITAEVARAIELNREAFAELMRSAADLELSNEAIIANLVSSVNVFMHDKYASGDWGYHAWRIERAEQ